jgi:hypothetical protein
MWIAVTRVTQHLDDLGAHLGYADVIGVLVVICQADLHIRVAGGLRPALDNTLVVGAEFVHVIALVGPAAGVEKGSSTPN